MRAASLVITLLLISEATGAAQSQLESAFRSAEILKDTRKYQEAEIQLRKTISSLPPSSDWLPPFWWLLGIVHHNQGRFEEAELCLTTALSKAEALFGRDSIWVLRVKQSLSALLTETGRFSESEGVLRPAIAAGERLYGPEHPDVMSLMNNLGLVLQKRGDATRAEPLLRRLVAMAEKTNQNRVSLGELHHNLAVVYVEQGRPGMARQHLEKAIAIWNKLGSSGQPNLLHAQNSLVVVLMKEGRLREAEAMARKTAIAAASMLGDAHPLNATVLMNLGNVLAGMGRSVEALQTLEHAIQVYERTFGRHSPVLAEVLQGYASALRKAGRKQDAQRADSRAKTLIGH